MYEVGRVDFRLDTLEDVDHDRPIAHQVVSTFHHLQRAIRDGLRHRFDAREGDSFVLVAVPDLARSRNIAIPKANRLARPLEDDH